MDETRLRTIEQIEQFEQFEQFLCDHTDLAYRHGRPQTPRFLTSRSNASSDTGRPNR